jgi:hypothetical protein
MEAVMTESKVVIENGKVKTIFSEEINRTGYMTVEECGRLLHESIMRTEEILDKK